MAADIPVVLVTGGTGLVGQGIKSVVEKSGDGRSWVWLSSKECNLLDKASTTAAFAKYRPTYVIHLAARVGGLFANMRANLDFFRENMAINDNVLSACHEFGVKKCVSCLSTCVFPDQVSYPINETMLHNGPPHFSNEGYSYAKRMIDVWCRSYASQHPEGTRFVSVIPTNVFGPHDNFSLSDGHVLPALMHRCLLAVQQGHPEFVIWGSGRPLRQFIFSEDLGRLFVWVLDRYDAQEPIILSVPEEDERSIGDVARQLVECFGYEGKLVFDTSKADGQFKKTADAGKLRALYPEFEFTPFPEALQQSVDWLKANFETCRK